MKRSVIALLYLLNTYTYPALFIDTTQDSFSQLYKADLIDVDKPIRLHLGCGQIYLADYINIDFSSADHTFQTNSVADAYADITQLNFPANSIDVIESHHIFEHFDRQTALALLCAWQTWLKPGGLLIIETPDFEASIRVMLTPQLSYQEKQVTLRHIFGSHEAHWAYHYDGWYTEKFEHILAALGFSQISHELIAYYYLIPSILITAQKSQLIPIEVLGCTSKELLRESMVTSNESSLWDIWCAAFDKALKKLHL
ncbi:MAG: methyltransferase domain-containing protein [Epsilonproteobacteria bacterium]|nr:methyltransferase domain-containing protein [Campylobacterota bacterium]